MLIHIMILKHSFKSDSVHQQIVNMIALHIRLDLEALRMVVVEEQEGKEIAEAKQLPDIVN